MDKTVFIIENEKSILNIIKAFWEDAGYTVVLADDGIDGISKFHQCNPDLVLPVDRHRFHTYSTLPC